MQPYSTNQAHAYALLAVTELNNAGAEYACFGPCGARSEKEGDGAQQGLSIYSLVLDLGLAFARGKRGDRIVDRPTLYRANETLISNCA